ncbi:MAG TPA: LuxR C-terminal-related transcriptional regulator [Caldimonas sp.]|nr:LuxR C-terminal-related transcriptional regulator [Caldimonas sp.]HEX4234775.1 LuxR C-terminal-related transcriptional regulator [Caldimonas sp.]
MADSTDMQTLETRLVRFANELGFGIISGALILEHGAGRVSSIPFGNIPEAYKATSESDARGKRDPVMHRLKRLSTPFVYDQSTYVNEDAADIWEVQAFFGYKTGIAMALHLPGGKHFLMGVDRDEPLPGDEMLLTRMMADLQLLAVHAQETTIRLLVPESVEVQYLPRLTERELEILRWTAEGKSAWAVGQILSISEHNVKYHIKRILMKLAVGSKHQAAAKAKSLGLI